MSVMKTESQQTAVSWQYDAAAMTTESYNPKQEKSSIKSLTTKTFANIHDALLNDGA